MKPKKAGKDSAKAGFAKLVRELYPVAHGTLPRCGFAAHQGRGCAWGSGRLG